MSMSINDIKCKYMFVFPLKNFVACKGLREWFAHKQAMISTAVALVEAFFINRILEKLE